ncbi:unnamed protein product, partial [Polarella glacialis]
ARLGPETLQQGQPSMLQADQQLNLQPIPPTTITTAATPTTTTATSLQAAQQEEMQQRLQQELQQRQQQEQVLPLQPPLKRPVASANLPEPEAASSSAPHDAGVLSLGPPQRKPQLASARGNASYRAADSAPPPKKRSAEAAP